MLHQPSLERSESEGCLAGDAQREADYGLLTIRAQDYGLACQPN